MRRATVVLLLLLAGCASTPDRLSEEMLADRLFCGLTIPGGGEVSEEAWRGFVRDEVTPRFPDGFTVWRAEGQWRGPDGVVVREPVLVIEIVRRPSLTLDREIFEIAEAYRQRFRQDAVMRVTMPARVEFID